MDKLITIKGIREGLLVTLGEGEWLEVQEALLNQLEEQVDFLRGAKLILDVQNRPLNAASMGKLRDLLSDRDLSLWAVLSFSPLTEKTAQTLGLATKIKGKQEDITSINKDIPLEEDEGILVKQTLRSGNRLEYPGHITVIGDVNPGAEIIAGGHIVIFGKLRGMVHAGCEGNENAIVVALEMNPLQLRIAEKIAIPPDDNLERKPEIAFIRDGQVVAEPWKL